MKNLLPWIKLWGLLMFVLSCAGAQKPSHQTPSSLIRQDLESKGKELYRQQKWGELSDMLKDSRWQSCLSQPLCQHDWTLLQITALIRQGKSLEAMRLWSSVRPELISGDFLSWLYFYEGSRLLASTNQVAKSLALIDECKKTSDTYQWSTEQQMAMQFRENLLQGFESTQRLSSFKNFTFSIQHTFGEYNSSFLKPTHLSPQSLEELYTLIAEDLTWLGKEEAERNWTVRIWRVDSLLQLSLLGTQWEIFSIKKLEPIEREWTLAKKEAMLPTTKSLRNKRLLQLQNLLNHLSLKATSPSPRQVASLNSSSARTSELLTWLTQERKKLDQLLYSPVISPSSTRSWIEIYPNKATDFNKSF